MTGLDTDGSGKVSLDEFLVWWLTGEMPHAELYTNPNAWEECVYTTELESPRTYYYNVVTGTTQYTRPRFRSDIVGGKKKGRHAVVEIPRYDETVANDSEKSALRVFRAHDDWRLGYMDATRLPVLLDALEYNVERETAETLQEGLQGGWKDGTADTMSISQLCVFVV
jgi:hypothetical protein